MVEPGNYEAIYSNMPVFGLAKATEHIPAVERRETARRRLMRGDNEPAVPSTERSGIEARQALSVPKACRRPDPAESELFQTGGS